MQVNAFEIIVNVIIKKLYMQYNQLLSGDDDDINKTKQRQKHNSLKFNLISDHLERADFQQCHKSELLFSFGRAYF